MIKGGIRYYEAIQKLALKDGCEVVKFQKKNLIIMINKEGRTMLYIVYTNTGKKEIFYDREEALIFYATNGGVTMTERHATEYYNDVYTHTA